MKVNCTVVRVESCFDLDWNCDRFSVFLSRFESPLAHRLHSLFIYALIQPLFYLGYREVFPPRRRLRKENKFLVRLARAPNQNTQGLEQ